MAKIAAKTSGQACPGDMVLEMRPAINLYKENGECALFEAHFALQLFEATKPQPTRPHTNLRQYQPGE